MNTFAKMTKAKKGELEIALADYLHRLTGLDDIKVLVDVDRIKNGERLSVTSNELANYQYPKMFKSLKVGDFGGGWTRLQGREPVYWLPIKYRYEHFSGGTNGSEIAIFWIKQDGTIANYRNELE
jgi:hypothetical protein